MSAQAAQGSQAGDFSAIQAQLVSIQAQLVAMQAEIVAIHQLFQEITFQNQKRIGGMWVLQEGERVVRVMSGDGLKT